MLSEKHWKATNVSDVAIFDLDDTLLDLKSMIVESLNRRTGKSLTVDQFDNNAEYYYGVTTDQFLQIAEEDMMLQKALPHEGIHELFQTLREQNTRIVIVTARNWHPHARQITKDWFHSLKLEVDEIIIVGLQQSKSHVVSHFDNVRFAIDDRPDVVLDYSVHSGLNNAFLYSQKWNEHASDLKRVHSLLELNELLRSNSI